MTILCLLVFGKIPAWIMLCLCLFAVLLLCTGRLFERDSNLGRSFFVLILPVTLVLCVLLIFKGPASYDYNRQNQSLVQLAQAFTAKLTAAFHQDGELLPVAVLTPDDSAGTPGTENDRWSDGACRLDVSAVTDENQLQEVLMRFTAGRDGQLYLRHCSYGGYTGTGWGTAPEYPGGSVPNFAAWAVENSGVAEAEEVSIELIAADSGLLYLPY